ncbi:MAG: DNA-methyltransferase [Candidatus Hodarchaeales archaeon]
MSSWREEYLNVPTCSDAIEFLKKIPDGVVQCGLTSPPYLGMRVYPGDQEMVWGGKDGCDHIWEETLPLTRIRDIRKEEELDPKRKEAWKEAATRKPGKLCRKCGRWIGSLGLEYSVDQFISNIVSVFKEVKRVLTKNGTFFLNIGESYCRINYPQDHLKKKDMLLVPSRLARALQKDGWWVRCEIPWIRFNPVPQSVMNRPHISHEWIWMLTKSDNSYYNEDSVRVKQKSEGYTKKKRKSISSKYDGIKDEEAHRSGFHSGKGLKPHPIGRLRRTADWYYESFDILIDEMKEYIGHLQRIKNNGGLLLDLENNPIASLVNIVPSKGKHRASYSTMLIDPLIECSSKPGDIVLDPFLGSGTTAVAAKMLKRDFLGCDISEEYIEICKERLDMDERRKGKLNWEDCEDGY